MHLQEFRKLVSDENKNTLMNHSVFMLSNEELEEKQYIINLVRDLVQKSKRKTDISASKEDLDRLYNLSGKGTKIEPYSIETPFGCGEFFPFRQMFKMHLVPLFLAKQQCHSNSYEFARLMRCKSTVVSGISHYNNCTFLHSVILVNNWILDYNYDLVMSKDLYLKLFNFEICNFVASDDIKKNALEFDGDCKFFKQNQITYGDVNFCYYEILNILKSSHSFNVTL